MNPQSSVSFQWAYLVATYDGAIVRMYVNGEVVAQVRKCGIQNIYTRTCDQFIHENDEVLHGRSRVIAKVLSCLFCSCSGEDKSRRGLVVCFDTPQTTEVLSAGFDPLEAEARTRGVGDAIEI